MEEIRSETSLTNAVARKTEEVYKDSNAVKKSGIYVDDVRCDTGQSLTGETIYPSSRSVPNIKVHPPKRDSGKFVRQLPEQKTMVDPQYYKNILRKCVGCVLLAGTIIIVSYLLLKYVFYQPI